MTLTLPMNLDRYFAAQNAHDAEGMVACFAPDAKVKDEGKEYAGRDEVRGWKEATIAKYGISVEPLRMSERDGTTSVLAKVSGNFPGSPADLTYDFGLAPDGLIQTLAIH